MVELERTIFASKLNKTSICIEDKHGMAEGWKREINLKSLEPSLRFFFLMLLLKISEIILMINNDKL